MNVKEAMEANMLLNCGRITSGTAVVFYLDIIPVREALKDPRFSELLPPKKIIPPSALDIAGKAHQSVLANVVVVHDPNQGVWVYKPETINVYTPSENPILKEMVFGNKELEKTLGSSSRNVLSDPALLSELALFSMVMFETVAREYPKNFVKTSDGYEGNFLPISHNRLVKILRIARDKLDQILEQNPRS